MFRKYRFNEEEKSRSDLILLKLLFALIPTIGNNSSNKNSIVHNSNKIVKVKEKESFTLNNSSLELATSGQEDSIAQNFNLLIVDNQFLRIKVNVANELTVSESCSKVNIKDGKIIKDELSNVLKEIEQHVIISNKLAIDSLGLNMKNLGIEFTNEKTMIISTKLINFKHDSVDNSITINFELYYKSPTQSNIMSKFCPKMNSLYVMNLTELDKNDLTKWTDLSSNFALLYYQYRWKKYKLEEGYI